MKIPPEFPEFYTGSPVDAPDLRYRSAFLAGLWDTLKTKHVLLTSPRRTGKTSIMDHLRAYPENGYAVIYENVQDLYSRIDRYYDEPKISAAYSLLSQLSLSLEGLRRGRLLQEFERILDDEGIQLPAHKRQQQFNQLLRDLENDFYVCEIDEDLYDFASGILKSWWKKYYA